MTAVGRLTTTVLSLALAATLVLGGQSAGTGVGMLGVTLGALLLAALVLRRAAGHVAYSRVCTPAGPVGEERCLRGAFRTQSSPDTPGRPRSRAPGDGHRPA